MKNNRKYLGCYLTSQCLQRGIDTIDIETEFKKHTKDHKNVWTEQ